EGLAPDAAALRARGGRGAESRATLADYVTLTKPRIMSLLVLTAVCAMVAAAGGAPATVPLAALVIGGALACGARARSTTCSTATSTGSWVRARRRARSPPAAS